MGFFIINSFILWSILDTHIVGGVFGWVERRTHFMDVLVTASYVSEIEKTKTPIETKMPANSASIFGQNGYHQLRP